MLQITQYLQYKNPQENCIKLGGFGYVCNFTQTNKTRENSICQELTRSKT